jgi:1-acyl-sn-glycerol-3-phosphate acyltransferase
MSGETVKIAWYFVARFMCQVFCLTFFRFRVQGRQNVPTAGPSILASNHQSFLDPVFCGVAVKCRLLFMARDSLFRSRLFGGLIRSVNAIPIGRDRADIAAMKMVLKQLKEGHSVCLFPEGTRSPDGRIAAFKPGFGLLCRRSGAAVVPVLVDGAFECWPRHKKLFSPGPITVCIGTALRPEQVRGMSNEQLADHLTRTLRQMQHDCRLEQGKKPFEYSQKSLP